MRSARSRYEAEKVVEVDAWDPDEQDEKKEPGENSSDSRRESGEVVLVEAVDEA